MITTSFPRKHDNYSINLKQIISLHDSLIWEAKNGFGAKMMSFSKEEMDIHS